MTFTGVESIIENMTHGTLTEHGLRSVREVLIYLKQKSGKQLEAAPIFVSSMIFYPQMSGEIQVEIFKYLENQGFLSVDIERGFVDSDGKYLYEDKKWLEGLALFSKSINEPLDKTYDIELMKNSYDFTVNLAKDFDVKYQEFMSLVEDDESQVAYQIKIGKKNGRFVLYVKTANMGNRKIRWLTEDKLPIRLLQRLLRPENKNRSVDVGDLLKETKQTVVQLLNSVLDPVLRSIFFPHTEGTGVLVRPEITLEMIYKEKIDRKAIESKLKNLLRI